MTGTALLVWQSQMLGLQGDAVCWNSLGHPHEVISSMPIDSIAKQMLMHTPISALCMLPHTKLTVATMGSAHCKSLIDCFINPTSPSLIIPRVSIDCIGFCKFIDCWNGDILNCYCQEHCVKLRDSHLSVLPGLSSLDSAQCPVGWTHLNTKEPNCDEWKTEPVSSVTLITVALGGGSREESSWRR